MRLKKKWDRIKIFRDWYCIIVRMKIVKKTEDYIKQVNERERRKKNRGEEKEKRKSTQRSNIT